MGVCDADDDHWLGYMPSREACIEACDADGYDAMAWDMNMRECVCFMQDQCFASDTDDWCWWRQGRIPALDDVRGGLRRARMRLLLGLVEWSHCECEDPDSCASAGESHSAIPSDRWRSRATSR